MKNTTRIQAFLLLSFFMSLPFLLLSQEKEVKEKKVTVKTVKEVDGKKIIKDTTFVLTGDENVKEIVKEFTMEIDGDSSGTATIDVMVNVDEDKEWTTEKGKKVIVMKSGNSHDIDFYDEEDNVKVITIDDNGNKKVIVKSGPHSGHKKVIKYKTGDGEDEKIIIVSPHGNHSKSVSWVSEDGKTYEYDFDIDVDMEDFHHEMNELKAEMIEMHIEMTDENMQMHEELIELESLKELADLEALEELNEMEVYVVPPAPPARYKKHVYRDFSRNRGMEVSDEELREAGIKNKPDRLELDKININKDNGVVDLSFSLKAEGTPKVIVYNVYGDKVFNAKPELLNGNFETKIDLSSKQPGNYFLMIVLGNSSKTLRLNN